MRSGVLRRVRLPGAAIGLYAIAISLLGPALPRRADAKLDPLRIVTTQIVRPNILVVLDSSGSMFWRPEDSTHVGGDCYNGTDCVTTALANTCTNGLTCSPANTCSSGDACTAGTNTYCADGSLCQSKYTCGAGASMTECTATTATCRNGSACGKSCSKTTTQYCTGDTNCSARSCNYRCQTSGKACNVNADCGAGDTCRTTSSKRCNYGGPGTPYDSSQTCSSASDCAQNTCTGGAFCDASAAGNGGNSTCGKFCGDGSLCSSSAANVCTAASGQLSACGRECPDGSSCYGAAHCGSGSCPTSAQVYRGSSRMAIAKHAVSNIIDSTQELVNWGLMTYNQTGYWTYTITTSGTSTTTQESACFTQDDLDDYGAWQNNAPKTSFTRSGNTYTLKPTGGTGNASYRRGSRGNRTSADHDFCGTSCSFGGYSWSFQQACYTYPKTVTTGGTSTTSLQSSFIGNTATIGASTAQYFNYTPSINSSSTKPVDGAGSYSGSSCSDSSRNDGALRVGLTTSDTASTRSQVVTDMKQWLAKMTQGGIVPDGGTPIGCSLQYNYSTGGDAPSGVGKTHDAYSYLHDQQAADTYNACRKTYVILVTDGEPNGPGDSSSSCSSAACATGSLSGCTCSSVLAARHLKDDLGIKTYVVGFGAETAGSDSLQNIGQAGGTCQANGRCYYAAANEDALVGSLESAVYDAVRGDYATSPPTVASSTGSAYAGDLSLLSSTEFPSWRGHLKAVDIVHLDAGGNPTLRWDAGPLLASRDWNTRRVFTSNPNAGNAIVPFLTTSGAVNKAALYAAGLGASADDAEAIAQFALGKDRDWKLGSFINSTPVTVSNSVDINLPGHAAFNSAHSTRPKLVYVGGDDGMLHAFFLETGPNGELPGSEAWAYVPPNLFPSLTALFGQDGQKSNPGSHIYGVASSPKVNDTCTAPCQAADDWKTVLVAGEGAGGAHYFALDITNPMATSPFSVLWNTSSISAFAGKVGDGWSVPAFAFTGSGSSLQGVALFASGYDRTPTDANPDGQYLFMVNPITGANVGAPFRISPPSSPITTCALVADLAVANEPDTQKAIAGYQVDLGGRLWRVASASTPAGSPFYDAGATCPFYYSPAVNALSTTDVLIAAVDKTFDDVEINPTSSPPAAPKLHVVLDKAGTAVSSVTVPFTAMCKNTCHNRACSGCTTFSQYARPVSSPVIINNLDTSATARTQVLVEIFEPVPNSCAKGSTTLVVVDLTVSGTSVTTTQSEAKQVLGNGRSAGLFIGAGGVLVSGASGSGSSMSTISVIAGAPTLISSSTPTATNYARVLGITESDY